MRGLVLCWVAFLPLVATGQGLRVAAADSLHLVEQGYVVPADTTVGWQLVRQLRLQAHPLANLDQAGPGAYDLYLGPHYDWLRLDSTGRVMPFARSERYRLRRLQHWQDQGFARAQVRFQYAGQQGDTLVARLQELPGDTVFVGVVDTDPGVVHPAHLAQLAELAPGQVFRRNQLEQLPRRLAHYPYLELVSAPQVLLTGAEANVTIPLRKAQADQLDMVLGFFPGPDGGLLLTGDVSLDLQNLWRRGHSVQLDWERFGQQRQVLEVAYGYPFFLQTNLALQGAFALRRQDSSFVQRQATLELHGRPDADWQPGLTYEFRSADVIGEGLQLQDSLRNRNDHFLGLSLRWARLDHPFFPQSGWHVRARSAVGVSRLEAQGDQGTENLTSLQAAARLRRFQPLGARLVLLAQAEGGLFASDQVYRADQVQLGGLNSLRGFSERFFFADQWASTMAELRWHWQPQSFFLAFVQQSWLYDSVTRSDDRPLGVGLGLALQTGPGIFQLIFAAGSSRQQELRVDQARAHLGFSLRF